jgi:hypothetical protein
VRWKLVPIQGLFLTKVTILQSTQLLFIAPRAPGHFADDVPWHCHRNVIGQYTVTDFKLPVSVLVCQCTILPFLVQPCIQKRMYWYVPVRATLYCLVLCDQGSRYRIPGPGQPDSDDAGCHSLLPYYLRMHSESGDSASGWPGSFARHVPVGRPGPGRLPARRIRAGPMDASQCGNDRPGFGLVAVS